MSKIRMMMVLVGLTLATVANAAFVDQWAVPWFDNTNGNPYTDGDGNQWGAYKTSWSNPTEWSNYSQLTWNGDHWGTGNASFWNLQLKGANVDTDTSGLVFTPSQAGDYSWTGTVTFWNSSGWAGQFINFIKFTGSTGTSLYANSFSNSESLDLNAVSSLQNISLTSNDKLAVITTAIGGAYGVSRLGSVSLGFVPEPVSMVLFGLGGIALLKRRMA